jgi:cytochrome P450
VARIDHPALAPFWAVTRHADVVRVSRDPATFVSSRGNTLPPRELARRAHMPLAVTLRAAWRTGALFRPGLLATVLAAGWSARRKKGTEGVLRNLLTMDPPEHGAYRELARARFTPRALRELEPLVAGLARDAVARLRRRALDPALRATPFDLVTELAAPYPVAVISELLGFPREDHERLLRWSNAIVGSIDEEYGDRANPLQAVEEARLGLFDYFARQVRERRRSPRADLVSLIASAQLGGRRIAAFEALNYCFLLLLAGNETTRNAISGGLLALIERPGEAKRLREEPALLVYAAEEIVRWTSPIVYFVRTAAHAVELGGRKIAAGDRLALFYPSANRDEAVFAEPERFDVGRHPNRHLGFGIGEHVCLGAHLARLEIRALLHEALSELPPLELAGPVSRLRSNFVGGIKHLPVRFAAA